MDAETGEAIQIDGKPVTSEKTFTAKKSSGTVEVSFTFDASSLSGKTTVVFEELYQEDKQLAVHADLSDEDQQISFPEIGTQAIDSETGEHMANADEKVKLIDTIWCNYCCATVPSLLRTIGPIIIAMTILHRSAGMKGMTQTASAAPTVYPAWRQNHAVPNA